MSATRDQMLAWAKGWKRAAPVLSALRDKETHQASTAEAIEMFDSSFKSALLHVRAASSSGLVIQQKLFRKLYPR